ncbi:PrsW family intramembrane metalloprotease [Polaribacter aestuariivivens]|uniref:PrsW family intramembrane metalloprotease n=1 Tax=Polaribacter aestuariivivens TaxID=2304626 RepID=UPI003F499A08
MSLLFLAIAPVLVIIIYIYIKDKHEKEPIGLLTKSFLLGATVSIILTLILGYLAAKVFPLTEVKNILQQFIQAFFVVALVEEFSKYVIVRFFSQKNIAFNEPFDGIVYAVMVSMGFAALENILYTFQHGAETGILRAFTAVPAHATFVKDKIVGVN